MIGVVSSMDRCADGTDLELSTMHGPHRVCVQAVADLEGAARVERSFRRCLSVRLTYADMAWSSVVQAIGNRHPVDVPVSNATALGLVQRGLPSVVRLS